MVDTVYWLPIGGLAAQAGWLRPKVEGHLAPFLYSSREPGELSQWLCYDDSTINIVIIIIIIIIIITRWKRYINRFEKRTKMFKSADLQELFEQRLSYLKMWQRFVGQRHQPCLTHTKHNVTKITTNRKTKQDLLML